MMIVRAAFAAAFTLGVLAASLAVEAQAETIDRIGALARTVAINYGSDVILTRGTPATIPSAMTGIGDPAGSGIIASLGRPGGNITALTAHTTGVSAKRCARLSERRGHRKLRPAPFDIKRDTTRGAMSARQRRAGRRRVSPRVDYPTLADLRYQIRRFLRVRETAARAAGLEPQQYLLLLQVKGLQARGPVTVGALAERLQVRHHSAVELIDRLADRGLVGRRRDSGDRRQVHVEIRPAGEAILRRLSLLSLAELRQAGPKLVEALTRLIGDNHAAGARPARRKPKGGRP